MQGSVYIPKIVQLHHPSGELYESYRLFAEAHPEGSWFQSDAFFRFISLWPEAQPILLVALSEDALQDPGRRYSKTSDPGRNPGHPTTREQSQPPQATSNIKSRIVTSRDFASAQPQTSNQTTPGPAKSYPPGSPLTPQPHNPATLKPGNGQVKPCPYDTPLMNMGAGQVRPTQTSTQRATSDSPGGVPTNLLGSLLAVVIQNPVPTLINFFPLAAAYKRFTARTVVYGGPLLSKGTRLEREMTLKTLLGALNDTAGKQSLFTQFRNFSDLSDHKSLFYQQGYSYHDRLNLLVDTPDTDTVWKQMSGSRRRQVRKSLASGAELVYDPTPEQIDAYYDILKTLYRKKVRKPLPSRTFFHALNPHSAHYTVPGFQKPHHPRESDTRQETNPSTAYQTNNNTSGNPITPQPHNPETDEPDDGQVKPCPYDTPLMNNMGGGQVRPTQTGTQRATSNAKLQTSNPFTTILIRHHTRIIGGITTPIHPGRAMYEWYVCGLDHEYKSRNIHPSVLATWAAMDHAAKLGVQRFDFMGLGKPEEPYGVREFKARFGGTWVNYGRFSRVNKRVGYAISEIIYNLKRVFLMC